MYHYNIYPTTRIHGAAPDHHWNKPAHGRVPHQPRHEVPHTTLPLHPIQTPVPARASGRVRVLFTHTKVDPIDSYI